jgi:hypothetical protein
MYRYERLKKRTCITSVQVQEAGKTDVRVQRMYKYRTPENRTGKLIGQV